MLGQMKMLWRTWIADEPCEAQSDLEDLPVSHAKQLTCFFRFCLDAGEKALNRNADDEYETCSDLEEIG